jgi:hypothetical protein
MAIKTASKVWISKALKMGWHEFICTYVAAKTKKPVSGYTVRKVESGWEMLSGGLSMFQPMSASTAYSWFVRTPGLCTLARQADEIRELAYFPRP